MAAPRVVVVAYILAGIGHKRAAEAIVQTLRERGDTVHLVDVLDYMPGWFRWLCPRAYVFCVHWTPWLWALSFYVTDLAWFERLTGPLRRAGNRLMAHRFLRRLAEMRPSVLINTHFLPPEVVGAWKARALPSLVMWNVVTDYRPHAWWVTPGTDQYFVGLEETRAALVRRGVPEERITVSGIPVSPVFHQPFDRAALRAKHQLSAESLTLLVTSGGYGIGPMQRLCDALARIEGPAGERLQIIVIAGDNPHLQTTLQALASRARVPMRIVGFTREMHELMAAVDIVVTKPGGLTVTESLVMNRPLVLFAPIWGQETGNAEILVQRGVAVWLRQPEDVGPLLKRWAHDSEELARMRKRVTEFRRVPAAELIMARLSRI